MKPTLRNLELLEIIPYKNQTVQVGDVILFLPPGGNQPVVHRVSSVTPKGIRTRGDNSLHDDPWLLQSSNISGQVVAAWRGQACRKIAGGMTGWLWSHLICCLRIPVRSVSFLLRPIYHIIARFGILHRVLPAPFKPRIVTFQAGEGKQIWILLGNRVVGQYNPQQHQWEIQPPFRLFTENICIPGLPT